MQKDGHRVGDRATSFFTNERVLGSLCVRLSAAGGVTSGQGLELCSGSCVVGSAAGADFILDHATVSRRHVELEVQPNGVSVRDLGSTNGVYHLGNRVRHLVLGSDATLLLGQASLRIEIDPVRVSQPPSVVEYGGLATANAVMKRLIGTLKRLERSLINVLIVGETGTGKEVVARALHAHSRVKDGPFVAVNCGALPRDLIHSELFGHRRGAFTGALETRRGAFELAEGGTLFLDEIGELPETAQPVLLRALQERTIVPVGESIPRAVNVRVVAATNRRLHQDVVERKFREDLFYRLNGVSLELPPLRERVEDIPMLARYFALRGDLPELTPAVLSELSSHSWPGNVRELEQAVSAYGVLETLPRVVHQLDWTPAKEKTIDLERPYEELKRDALEQFQSDYLKALLEHTGGNISAAARLSGLERSYLGKLLRRSV